ncbi:MAG: peptide chain release factor N(5)-glutamine methyltransferase [Cryomorphaceae bacterium]|nr:peptide chain release factor N(5)-glutamine methyltransferase [Flavobacteriales bacterium]
MIQSNPTVEYVATRFRTELSELYPYREIEQMLTMAFEEVMNLSKIDVLTVADAQVGEPQIAKFEGILKGLKRQEPIQYLIGHAVFYDLSLKLNSAVLIPRPETEELVHWILKDDLPHMPRIIDLGTGSGCIALALKDHLPHAQVFGVDNSFDALNVANGNAAANDLQVEFFHFDMLEQESLGFMDFDVMVSNPPYVTPSEKAQMDDNVLNYEPHHALFVPEEDPLIFYRRIVDLADGHLNKGGRIYFEINRAYGKDIAQLLRDRNYAAVEIKTDLNGNERMIRASKV